MQLEKYFESFRNEIIGQTQSFESPYGTQRIVYADWTASGRMYRPIEKLLSEEIAPFVGNTHTETTITGCAMTKAYKKALGVIKKHVNAKPSDVIISSNSGMTGVVNKFQRILGLKVAERFRGDIRLSENERPIVFVTHMEHHSNQTSWLETLAEVKVIQPTAEGLVDLEHLKILLEQYAHRTYKIAAITGCSNVTGIKTPYHKIAALMHAHDGLCFVDFACSAPYVAIDMHPENEAERLDAIYFSPHKFLGGPATSGILIFDSVLYQNAVPDHPGGGTVDWTNPWGEHKYIDDIEAREDGGTPSFLQTIKVALCVQLKEKMGVDNILRREEELLAQIWPKLEAIPNIHILAPQHKDRLGVISFYVENAHHNLIVKLLNDRFGVQVRGGCSCAGTYGHYLLEISRSHSKSITTQLDEGALFLKPGWVRMSIHPTMTDEELQYILKAIEVVAANHESWSTEYSYCPKRNEYTHNSALATEDILVDKWLGSLALAD